MKIVSNRDAKPKERKTVDYCLLADYYNRCGEGDAVELEKVSNVTLFKKSLNLRGIASDVDFQAYNKDEKTYVKRLTMVRMSATFALDIRETTMEELKIELLKIGKEKGDSGGTPLQREWIDRFLDAALQYLTPDAILSFAPLDMRALYVLWLQKYLETHSFDAAREMIPLHIELSMEPRQALAPKPSGANVESIFERKADQ